MKKVILKQPQTIFLIVGLVYGLAFLIVMPPLQIVDEGEHFDKALYLSEANVMPVLERYPGYHVPKSTDDLKLKFYSISKDKNEKINLNEIFFLLYQPLNSTNQVFTSTVSSTAIITYSPVPYLASAFAIFVGRLLNFSPIILMYLGRLANLLVWLFLIYRAIKLTPVHKWVLLMLALMPIVISQGASLSADSFTIALSFLVIAIFLKFSFDDNKKEINTKDIIVLFFLLLMLALTKQAYIFLVFLYFLIPMAKFGNKKKKLFVFCVLLVSTFGISIIWNMVVKGFYIPINVSIPFQTSLILSDPLNFPNALLNTSLIKDYQIGIVNSFVSGLGWNVIVLPFWLTAVYLFVLVLTSLLDKSDKIINYKQKIILFTISFVVFIFICVLMYITGNPAAYYTIHSINGRYLIPIAPLLFLLFYNNKIKFDIEKAFNLVVIGLIVFTLTTTLYLLIKNYYVLL